MFPSVYKEIVIIIDVDVQDIIIIELFFVKLDIWLDVLFIFKVVDLKLASSPSY